MGCNQSSPGNADAASEATFDVMGYSWRRRATETEARQRTDRLLLAKAVAAEFEHPALASVDEALLGVLKREVWALAQPRLISPSEIADLMKEPVKTGPSLEDYYGYEPGPGIERGISRGRVEELLARTDSATQERLLSSGWATLDWHRRRELLEKQLGDEFSWFELVRRWSEQRSAER